MNPFDELKINHTHKKIENKFITKFHLFSKYREILRNTPTDKVLVKN